MCRLARRPSVQIKESKSFPSYRNIYDRHIGSPVRSAFLFLLSKFYLGQGNTWYVISISYGTGSLSIVSGSCRSRDWNVRCCMLLRDSSTHNCIRIFAREKKEIESIYVCVRVCVCDSHTMTYLQSIYARDHWKYVFFFILFSIKATDNLKRERS